MFQCYYLYLSSLISALTPLIITLANSTSLYPNLFLLETSYKSPVSPPLSPLEPLGCNPSSAHLFLRAYFPASSLAHPGK